MVRVVTRHAAGWKLSDIFKPQGSLVAGRWPLWAAMRPAQWSKSLLLLGPSVFAHAAPSSDGALNLLLGVVLMSMTASAGYLVNDVTDRNSDRNHPTKRNRPIAAGLVDVRLALALATAMAGTAIGLAAAFLGFQVAMLLAGYLVASIVYSSVLKTLPVIDVIVLACFYMWRLAIGGAISGIVLSEWLLAFGFALFVALALAKRLDEVSISAVAPLPSSRRFYQAAHRGRLAALCLICGLLSVGTLAGYVAFSNAALEHYRNHAFLWLATALLGIWLVHMFDRAKRGKLEGDPVLFALSDPLSLVMVAATGAALIAAV